MAFTPARPRAKRKRSNPVLRSGLALACGLAMAMGAAPGFAAIRSATGADPTDSAGTANQARISQKSADSTQAETRSNPRRSGRRALAVDGDGAVSPEPGCGTTVLTRNDDGSSDRVDLPFPVNFFGNTHNSLYVNNNGNVTFDMPMGQYTPFALTESTAIPVIAPFFADVDTTNPDSAEVTYGVADDGKTFCVNWTGVGYYASHADKLLSAQLELIDRSGESGGRPGDFDIVMNYDKVEWETGDASQGSGGFGGLSARIGYSAGTGLPGTFYEFPGSGVSQAFLDSSPTGLIHSSRDSTVDGRYVFAVRSGDVPVGAGISGTVRSGADGSTPVPDGFVQVCPTSGTRGCHTSSTNSEGGYSVSGLPAGEYRITAYPPGSSPAAPGSRTVTVPEASGLLEGQDIVLHVPSGPPTGTSITSISTNSDGLPVLYWGDPLTLRTHGCAGAEATWKLTRDGETLRTGALTEGADGEYTAAIDPLRPASGYASVEITLVCPGGTSTHTVFDVYIDPSGTVVDTYGHPVEGAEVTLYRAEDQYGEFVPVPDGSGIMSVANRRNPVTTTETGYFGWDVVAGTYLVTARHDGCVSADDPQTPYAATPVLTVPPPATDLQLVLDCSGNRPPTAEDRELLTDEDTTAQIDLRTGLTDPDEDPVTIDFVTTPEHGDLSCTADWICDYAPAPDFFGDDAFGYVVSDSRGGTSFGTVSITVSAVNDLPTAAFTVDPAAGDAPLTVRFDAAGSLDVEGIASYTWNFGDGTSGEGVTAEHTYAEPGNYTVMLTVTDTDGATDVADGTVEVSDSTPARMRDTLTIDRSGSQTYRIGGELDSGDFVISHRRGLLRGIDGTGTIDGKTVNINVTANGRGRAHGRITVADTATGRIVDRIRVRGTFPTEDGPAITGTSVWGHSGQHLERAVWSVTDVPMQH